MIAFDGERLLRRRMEVGLSLRELAAELGVDPGTLSRWERGIKAPNRRNQMRIEALLGPERRRGRHGLGA